MGIGDPYQESVESRPEVLRDLRAQEMGPLGR